LEDFSIQFVRGDDSCENVSHAFSSKFSKVEEAWMEVGLWGNNK